ncbi:RAMP superfamily protein [compost metagenome]
MNAKHVYYIDLVAESPAFFGGNEQGELLKNGQGELFLTGNSIGGALREYLIRIQVAPELIIKAMGGVVEQERVDKLESLEEDPSSDFTFQESKLYISDGMITAAEKGVTEFPVKHGTSVDAAWGAAKEHHKYNLEYMEAGCLLSFRIECNFEETNRRDLKEKQLQPDELELLIRTWVAGIQEGALRLGGQKSNGFGKFFNKVLGRSVFSFDSVAEIEKYIFDRHKETDPKELLNHWIQEKRETFPTITFTQEGIFPYGVYQSFEDLELTKQLKKQISGLQKNKAGISYIPASSLKGLLRYEFETLLRRMVASKRFENISQKDFVENLCEQWLGSTQRKGKLIVNDLVFTEEQSVKVDRPREKNDLPVYVKIDRLTGGVMEGALKHQNEIQGKARWSLDFYTEKSISNKTEISPFLFPLIYMMRRIGSGKVPVGGRTTIGLGEFKAEYTKVHDNGLDYEISNNENIKSDTHSYEWMRECYAEFTRWIESEYKCAEGMNSNDSHSAIEA